MRGESELDMAERHIREAEAHVAEQMERIELLRRDGHPTLRSEIILKAYESTLELYRECLATLRAAHAAETEPVFKQDPDKP